MCNISWLIPLKLRALAAVNSYTQHYSTIGPESPKNLNNTDEILGNLVPLF